MRGAAQTLRRRVGHRGSALLFFALVDVVYCWSMIFPASPDQQGPWLRYLAGVLPLPVWGVAWGTVGLICLRAAFQRQDAGAFAAAVGIKALWATLALAAGVAGGVDRWYVTAVVWLAFAGFVGIIASWPEPPHGWKDRQWTSPSG
ncbi:hypothetical protein AB0K20_23355 [Micromonospora matsumotoense]|uniref:hypothetical protein n=1 Tax=Micromonospora matsumotoense TaxID=121616 RepID=UPI00344ACD50